MITVACLCLIEQSNISLSGSTNGVNLEQGNLLVQTKTASHLFYLLRVFIFDLSFNSNKLLQLDHI